MPISQEDSISSTKQQSSHFVGCDEAHMCTSNISVAATETVDQRTISVPAEHESSCKYPAESGEMTKLNREQLYRDFPVHCELSTSSGLMQHKNYTTYATQFMQQPSFKSTVDKSSTLDLRSESLQHQLPRCNCEAVEENVTTGFKHKLILEQCQCQHERKHQNFMDNRHGRDLSAALTEGDQVGNAKECEQGSSLTQQTSSMMSETWSNGCLRTCTPGTRLFQNVLTSELASGMRLESTRSHSQSKYYA